MSNKVLFCATVDEHIKGCHIPYLKWFNDNGFEVHVVTNGKEEFKFCHKKYTIDIKRVPFRLSNIKAYMQLKKIVKKEKYDIIHCHTPMGGVITRLASKKLREEGTKVIYTTHGFHFFRGSSIISWLIYYPIEKYLSKYTDCLITINKEDYNLAINKNFKCKDIRYVNGVGVNLERFNVLSEMDKKYIREKNGYKQNEFIIMYVAEINKNKNQKMLIKLMDKIKDKIPESKLVLVGPDNSNDKYKRLIENMGLNDKIDFLGFREDINELLNICDMYIASSIREGLGLNIIEAMACEIPVCATKNRGHNEIIDDGKNGYLIDMNDYNKLIDIVYMFYKNKELKKSMRINIKNSIEKFNIKNIYKDMENIYKEYI